MKKNKVISMILSFFVVLCFLCSCTSRENNRYDAKKIALTEFGFEDVLVVSVGTPVSKLKKDENGRLPIYVLGIKDNKECFIIVPVFTKYKSSYIDWPFKFSFAEIVKKFNDFGCTCEKSDYGKIEFIDDAEEMRDYYNGNLNVRALDVEFAIAVDYKYLAVQTDGDIAIYKR